MVLRSCGFGFAAFTTASVVWPLPNGIATSSCNGCHTANVSYDGTLSLNPAGELAPAIETEFTLRIEESHMKAAGFFVHSNRTGTFKAGAGNRATDEGVVHSKPVTAIDGVVEVKFSWTPPTQPDGLDMWVYVVAADDSSSQTGDIAVSAPFPVVWGCEGVTLYEDIDGDTYGNGEGARSRGCAAREGWAINDADCNDLWQSIHPGATEIANNKDDDCNGEVDDGVVVGVWYADVDGDGYGELGTDVEAENAPAGHVANSDDCNDQDATVSPEGFEVCDGRDNDCNRSIDDGDGVYVVCGVGICSRRWETCDSECVPGTPMPEVCDGLDDDCDGEVDEAVTCPDGSPCEGGSCPSAPALSSNLDGGAEFTSSPAPLADASASASAPKPPAPHVLPIDAGHGSPFAPASDAGEGDRGAKPQSPDRLPTSPASSGCGVVRCARVSWLWLAGAFGATIARRAIRRAHARSRA